MLIKIILAIYAATVICCCREYFRVMRELEKKYAYKKQSIFVIIGNNMSSILKFFIPGLNFLALISLWNFEVK